MVNVEKHKALKILNELTAPERLLVQCSNNKAFYNKKKFKANASVKFDKKYASKLESLAHKIKV